MKSIYIYGSSGHGLVVSDIAKTCGYERIIFIDDGDNEYQTFDDVKNENDTPIAFGIGSNVIRRKLFEKVYNCGFSIITLIHPSAVISSTACIGLGTVVMPNAVINSKSILGKGAIINTSSIIEHENVIGDFVHISPNVALAGNVTIESNSHIGIGTCVLQGLTIGADSVVGAGSVVVKSIGNKMLGYGNPCKTIKESSE